MESIKTANILLICVLVLGAIIIAVQLFSKESINTVPVTKSFLGLTTSGKPKKVQKIGADGKPVFEADGKTPVYV